MSQIAPLSVFDGSPTPVAIAFRPRSTSREGKVQTAVYVQDAPALPDEAKVLVTVKSTVLGSGVVRSSVRVEVPVMEPQSTVVVSGSNVAIAAPKKAFDETYEFIGYSHPRSSELSRRRARGLATNFAGGYDWANPAITTGPMSDLFDRREFPT